MWGEEGRHVIGIEIYIGRERGIYVEGRDTRDRGDGGECSGLEVPREKV